MPGSTRREIREAYARLAKEYHPEEHPKEFYVDHLDGIYEPIDSVDVWYLATIHRAENTDDIDKIRNILAAFEELDAPVIFPVHPRTKGLVTKLRDEHKYSNILFVQPMGYLDMLYFVKHAKKAVTDSGGLQKETYILDTPCVTVRDQTEWVETLIGNHNILAKPEKEDILDKVNHTVLKVWDDENNKDGLRTKVKVFLYADGVESTRADAEQELSEENNWTYTWKDLDKKNAATNTDIKYTVKERTTIDGYQTTTVDAATSTTITNTHASKKRAIVVKKVWEDNNSASRPRSVDVQLYADGKALGEKVILNGTNSWTNTWSDLPYYENGTEIAYTVKEVQVPTGYGVSYKTDEDQTTGTQTVTVTNSYPSTKRTVTKTWDDNNNQDRKRPSSVSVELLCDGQVYDTVTLSAANSWRYTWTEIPKYSNVSAQTPYV